MNAVAAMRRRAPDGTFLADDQIVLVDTERWDVVTFTLPCRRCHRGPVREREPSCPHCGGPSPWDDGA